MKKTSLMFACSYLIAGTAFAADKVDLSTATAPEIAHHVRGIGDKRAAAIVAYRSQHGLHTIEDLAHVRGIGPHFVSKHHAELEAAFILSTAKAK